MLSPRKLSSSSRLRPGGVAVTASNSRFRLVSACCMEAKDGVPTLSRRRIAGAVACGVEYWIVCCRTDDMWVVVDGASGEWTGDTSTDENDLGLERENGEQKENLNKMAKWDASSAISFSKKAATTDKK